MYFPYLGSLFVLAEEALSHVTHWVVCPCLWGIVRPSQQSPASLDTAPAALCQHGLAWQGSALGCSAATMWLCRTLLFNPPPTSSLWVSCAEITMQAHFWSSQFWSLSYQKRNVKIYATEMYINLFLIPYFYHSSCSSTSSCQRWISPLVLPHHFHWDLLLTSTCPINTCLNFGETEVLNCMLG